MKKERIYSLLTLVIGAGIGSVITWKVMETRYNTIIEEEIRSVKETFSKESQDTEEEKPDDATENTEEEEHERLSDVSDIINQNGYNTMSDEVREEKKKKGNDDTESKKGPHVISPEEFGELDYPIISLDYYTDDVLMNDRGKIITNAKELVGEDFASHFGEYEDDSDIVYVRNDLQCIDYEICRDYRESSEV